MYIIYKKKKKKKNLLINALNLAVHIKKNKKKGESDEYLNGLYHAQLTLLRSFDIDFTRIQVARNKGLTYDEMKEYLKQN